MSKLGSKGLAIVAAALLVVVGSAVAAGFGLTWLAVAGLGLLQVAAVGLLLLLRASVGKPSSSLRGVDTLSERMMAAIETERLSAVDRHKEIMAALGRPGGSV